MRELERKMEHCIKETSLRAAKHSVLDQRIEILNKKLQELKIDKVDFKDYVKLEQSSEYGIQNLEYRFDKLEKTLTSGLDYMLRYQPKETRNIVNRAVNKVTRPFFLKDLFYRNVVEFNP